MVVLTGLTGLASVFFLRASVRAFRLRETEEYLERIRRESEKYRALMRSAADAILLVEPTGERLLESNERARELLEPLGALTVDWLSICATDDDRSALRAGLRRAAEGEGTPVAVPQLLLRRPGEGRVEIDARLIALEYGGERVVQVSLRDLTREREMERQMQTAERLSSLGLLTAGVAHEINNPLEGIGNYLTIVTIVDDPDYLDEPFVQSRNYALDPDQVFPPRIGGVPFVEVAREQGQVPHYLPGENSSLREFSDRVGIPYEATRGGRDTMYPEYQRRLRELQPVTN
jgi:PAS domain S-box-containing protein